MEHPVLMTEAPLNPNANREKMVEICLGKFGAAAFYITTAAVLSLQHAHGGTLRSTGLVVDSGDSVTHVVPIYKGHVVSHAVRSIDVGGRDLDRHMLKHYAYELGFSITGGECLLARESNTRWATSRLSLSMLSSPTQSP